MASRNLDQRSGRYYQRVVQGTIVLTSNKLFDDPGKLTLSPSNDNKCACHRAVCDNAESRRSERWWLIAGWLFSPQVSTEFCDIPLSLG